MEGDLAERRTGSTTVAQTESEALRSALERIVFLECRADQLETALSAAEADRQRARSAASEGDRRESELHRSVAGLEARLADARASLADEKRRTEAREREAVEARSRAGAAEVGRERLFQRLVAWQKLLPDGGGGLDLASFIAELRGEIVVLEQERDAARDRERSMRRALEVAGLDEVLDAAPEAQGPAAVLAAAAELEVQGRLGIGPAEATAALDGLPTSIERRIAATLTTEIGRGPASSRARAAARLVELAGKRAAPALVAAAGSCQDPQARAVLVLELGRTGESRALPLVLRFAEDPVGDVRAAAFEAGARLSGGPAGAGILQAGTADPDPHVRRRMLLCATSLRGADPGPIAGPLLDDPDPQVRRLACAALGATRDPDLAARVIDRLADPESSVRAAAARAAEIFTGEDATALLALPPLGRRREIGRLRRLAARGPAAKGAPETVARPAPVTTEAVLAVVRTALQGASTADIASELNCTVEAAEAASAILVSQGRLGRRGRRLHLS